MQIWQHYAGFQLTYKDMIYCEIKFCGKKNIWYNDNNINSILILFIAKLGEKILSFLTTQTPAHPHTQHNAWRQQKLVDPGHDILPSPPFI